MRGQAKNCLLFIGTQRLEVRGGEVKREVRFATSSRMNIRGGNEDNEHRNSSVFRTRDCKGRRMWDDRRMLFIWEKHLNVYKKAKHRY